MKTRIQVTEALLEEAKAASGASTNSEVVRLALEALIRRAAYQRLAALRGSEQSARRRARTRRR